MNDTAETISAQRCWNRPCWVRKPRHAAGTYSLMTPQDDHAAECERRRMPTRVLPSAAAVVARAIAIDVAGARCRVRRRSQEFAQGAAGSGSASDRNTLNGLYARTVRPRRWPAAREAGSGRLQCRRAEDVVKTFGEFLIPIANQESERFRALREGPRYLPSLLNDPWRVRSSESVAGRDIPCGRCARNARRPRWLVAHETASERPQFRRFETRHQNHP